jgi:hypothetical protein
VVSSDFDQGRQFAHTIRDAKLAAWLEGAARRHCVQRGYGSFDGLERSGAVGPKVGDGAQQAASVGVRGRLKNVVLGGKFYQVAGIHHRNSVGDLRNYREIVRDEKHSQAELGAEFCQQVENLSLDGDIERGRGLVGDQQLRAIDDGHGDYDALAHAAGELVRIITGATIGVRDGYVFHGLDGALPGFVF